MISWPDNQAVYPIKSSKLYSVLIGKNEDDLHKLCTNGRQQGNKTIDENLSSSVTNIKEHIHDKQNKRKLHKSI